jgi:hypothetical protein
VPMVCELRVDPLMLPAGKGGWPLAHPPLVALHLAKDPGRGREILEQAATHHRGIGGPGSRDYVSAQIASDLVNYAGEKPDDRIMPGMEQNLVDILTVHTDAVNHFAGQDIECARNGRPRRAWGSPGVEP